MSERISDYTDKAEAGIPLSQEELERYYASLDADQLQEELNTLDGAEVQHTNRLRKIEQDLRPQLHRAINALDREEADRVQELATIGHDKQRVQKYLNVRRQEDERRRQREEDTRAIQWVEKALSDDDTPQTQSQVRRRPAAASSSQVRHAAAAPASQGDVRVAREKRPEDASDFRRNADEVLTFSANMKKGIFKRGTKDPDINLHGSYAYQADEKFKRDGTDMDGDDPRFSRRQKVGAVAAVLGLAGAGFLVLQNGGDDLERVAKSVEIGQGFDESGVSETEFVVGAMNLEPDVALHFGKQDGSGRIIMMPFSDDAKTESLAADGTSTHPNMFLESVSIKADVYDPDEPSAITIEEPKTEGDPYVAKVSLSELHPQLSVMNQEDGFYDFSLTDEELKMSDANKDFLRDLVGKKAGDYTFTDEAIDMFISSAEDKDLQEQVAYEAASSALNTLTSGDESMSAQAEAIRETLRAHVEEQVLARLAEQDPDREYKVELIGDFPDDNALRAEGIVIENTEDNASFGTRDKEGEQTDFLDIKSLDAFSADEINE